MPGRMEFEYGFKGAGAGDGSRRSSGEPMRILVMGDFSGRRNRGVVEDSAMIGTRPVLSVDVDNFEERMGRLAPRIALPAGKDGGAEIEVSFSTLEGFHPDELYDRLEIFQALRRTRKMLLDPETFPQAAAELRLSAPAEEDAPDVADAPAEEDGDTMARLLGKAPAKVDTPRDRPVRGFDIAGLIRNVVAPHIVPDPDPRQDQMVDSVDKGLTALMRSVLRHPDFRTLECAWWGVWDLITGLETGEELTVHILDISREEIDADLRAAQGDLSRCGLHHALVERGVGTAGGEPWSMIVTDFTFGPEPGDIATMAALGAIASRAGGPILAGASPAVLGVPTLVGATDPADWPGLTGEVAELWQAFRESPAAAWIGLALPRVLARLPYGADTDSIDRFFFEEMPAPREHEAYVWKSPAFSLALLLGRSFTMRGWSMSPGDELDVTDLPSHTLTVDGEKQMQPCAEVLLTERSAEAVLTQGIMPLMSYKNRDAARVARFQSVAHPTKGLAGPWG